MRSEDWHGRHTPPGLVCSPDVNTSLSACASAPGSSAAFPAFVSTAEEENTQSPHHHNWSINTDQSMSLDESCDADHQPNQSYQPGESHVTSGYWHVTTTYKLKSILLPIDTKIHTNSAWLHVNQMLNYVLYVRLSATISSCCHFMTNNYWKMMDCTPKVVIGVAVTEFPGTVSNSTVQSQLFHAYRIIYIEIKTFMPIMLCFVWNNVMWSRVTVRAQKEWLGTGAIQSCAVQENEMNQEL